MNDLRLSWSDRDASGVGRAIYDAVPRHWRPDWAGALLLHAAAGAPLREELATLVELSLSHTRWEWMDARQSFNAVRGLTLQNQEAKLMDSQEQLLLDIGETTAKVIYNASGGPAPYDFHAGWLMAPRVKALSDRIGRKDFEDDCWRLLIRQA